MPKIKRKGSKRIGVSHLLVGGIVLLVLLALALLWFNNSHSMQAVAAMVADVYFEGEYRISDGEWHKIVEGEHIPSTKGDVTLRGNLHMMTPDGEYVGIYRGDLPVAFYTDHISLTFFEEGREPFVIDAENHLYGQSSCGVSWTAHTFSSDSDATIEILVHNPHCYGNETAIDEMLSRVALWTGIEFEKEALRSGETERNIGLFFVIVSLMILGIALFSTLIHIKNTKVIWMLGIVILFAGIYFAYGADGVGFWSESVVSNTTILGASMMLYMFSLAMIIAMLLRVSRREGNISVVVLGVADAVFFLMPIVTDIYFYDTWRWWICVQIAVNCVLAGCLVREVIAASSRHKWLYVGALLPLIAYAADALGTFVGAWDGGVISRHVFIALLAAAMIMVLKFIPQNINTAAKARELEVEKAKLNAELAESRISTMMSQIRPHFIYNTLGSIEQLCELDPMKAGDQARRAALCFQACCR